jgi:Flp pilus assembly pilin Flp
VEKDMKALAVWCRRKIHAYTKDEAGAVTVDWVVLTAAICGLIMALFTILTESVYEDAAKGISERITDAGELYR